MDNIFVKFFIVLCFPVYLLDGYLDQFTFFDGWLGNILILVLYPTWVAIVLVFGYMLYDWLENKDFNHKPKDIEKPKPTPLPKFEEKYKKLKELTGKDTYGERIQTDEEILKEQLDTGEFEIKGNKSLTPHSPIRDWNGMCLSLAKNPDKYEFNIIFYDPKEKVWKETDGIDFYTYAKSLVWIE